LASLNKIMLIGNLGQDPELRYTPEGNPVANFSIAVTYRRRVNEEMQDETEWFNDEIIGTKHVDFFVKRSINYSKKTQSVTADDLF